jgi:hypothetical protein
MMDALRDFQVPTLHLVVADDQLVWQEQLTAFSPPDRAVGLLPDGPVPLRTALLRIV